MENNKYKMNMECSNCGDTFIMEFIKGVPCKRSPYGCYEFHFCPNCGCTKARATTKV